MTRCYTKACFYALVRVWLHFLLKFIKCLDFRFKAGMDPDRGHGLIKPRGPAGSPWAGARRGPLGLPRRPSYEVIVGPTGAPILPGPLNYYVDRVTRIP